LDKEERDIIHTESRQPAAAAANFPAGFKPKIKIKNNSCVCKRVFDVCVWSFFFPYKPDLIFVQEKRKKNIFLFLSIESDGGRPHTVRTV
jgi:hypothetical protein